MYLWLTETSLYSNIGKIAKLDNVGITIACTHQIYNKMYKMLATFPRCLSLSVEEVSF